MKETWTGLAPRSSILINNLNRRGYLLDVTQHPDQTWSACFSNIAGESFASSGNSLEEAIYNAAAPITEAATN